MRIQDTVRIYIGLSVDMLCITTVEKQKISASLLISGIDFSVQNIRTDLHDLTWLL